MYLIFLYDRNPQLKYLRLMNQVVLCRDVLQLKFLSLRGIFACTRWHGRLHKKSIRAYSRYKFEYRPEEPMAFVAGLTDVDRQKLRDSLQNYAAASEDAGHIEKPSNRKLRLG